LEKGVLRAPSTIDEHTTMPDPTGLPEPLLLDMGGVRVMNSYGTRRFMLFIRSWWPRAYEYVHSSSVFIETVNIVRDLLGPNRDPSLIKSLDLTLQCNDCQTHADVPFVLEQLDLARRDLGLDPGVCAKCGSPRALGFEVDDFLAFALE
jgi:hypothetical protein